MSETIVVEEVIELEDGTKCIGNSEEVLYAEGLQRVRAGGWKVQGLAIGKLPEVVAAVVAGDKANGRD